MSTQIQRKILKFHILQTSKIKDVTYPDLDEAVLSNVTGGGKTRLTTASQLVVVPHRPSHTLPGDPACTSIAHEHTPNDPKGHSHRQNPRHHEIINECHCRAKRL
jgi:hypothetical protein